MMDGDLDDLQPLSPLHFFQFQFPCRRLPKASFLAKCTEAERTQFLLPNLSAVGAESSFADVWMGWLPDGLEFFIRAKVPYQKVFYPEVSKGDSFEVFIDTRDLKNVGSVTRFCHQFFFLPEAVEGYQKGETSHFRGEDKHELCDSNLLNLKTQVTKTGYEMSIRIPTECLHGFDPEQVERIGFTYRINRSSGKAQYFSVSGEEFHFEQLPTLWSSLKLEGR